MMPSMPPSPGFPGCSMLPVRPYPHRLQEPNHKPFEVPRRECDRTREEFALDGGPTLHPCLLDQLLRWNLLRALALMVVDGTPASV